MLSVVDLHLFTRLQNDVVNTRLEPSVHAYGIILSEPGGISCTSLQNNVINTLLEPPLHAFRIMLSVLIWNLLYAFTELGCQYSIRNSRVHVFRIFSVLIWYLM